MRNRWIWIVGIVAVVVIVIGVVLATTLNHPTATPTATASTPVRTAQPTDTAPTGCLGGNARDANMLLVAQKAAPHTTNGAVEVAAALVRWTFRSPSFSTDEASEVSHSPGASYEPAVLLEVARRFCMSFHL